MSPQEKKKELRGNFEKKKKGNNKPFKSFADLNIIIPKEAIEEWRNTRC